MGNPILKWMIWGYHYFRKPPFVLFCVTCLQDFVSVSMSHQENPGCLSLPATASTRFQKALYKNLGCSVPMAITVFWVCIHFLLPWEFEVSSIREVKFRKCSRTMMIAMTITPTTMTMSTMTMEFAPQWQGRWSQNNKGPRDPTCEGRAWKMHCENTHSSRHHWNHPSNQFLVSSRKHPFWEPYFLQHPLLAADACGNSLATRPRGPGDLALFEHLGCRSSINRCINRCRCKDIHYNDS